MVRQNNIYVYEGERERAKKIESRFVDHKIVLYASLVVSEISAIKHKKKEMNYLLKYLQLQLFENVHLGTH